LKKAAIFLSIFLLSKASAEIPPSPEKGGAEGGIEKAIWKILSAQDLRPSPSVEPQGNKSG
jgi:hypothetical protein